MKRGIPIAVQAAGAVLACLVTTLNHPVTSHANLQSGVCYYNERGRELYCDTNTDSSKVFVIRTCKTTKSMYDDLYINKMKVNGPFDSAHIDGISRGMASKVETLILKREIANPLVKQYTVEILSKEFTRKMWDTIPDTGEGSDKGKDFQEYGGIIVNKTTFNSFTEGDKANPCSDTVPNVKPEGKGIGAFHSHPSGKNLIDSCFFIQAPSKNDLDFIEGGGVGYVFGMRSHVVYIFTKAGIQATVPFKFFLSKNINK
jgi:hypothetical protein